MNAKVMPADQARREWREVIDLVMTGSDVVVERYAKPTVAVIAYEDYVAILDELEDMRAARRAHHLRQAWLNGEIHGIALPEVKAQLQADGLLDE